MLRLIKLIKWEFILLNKVNNLILYFFSFFLLSIICFVLINDHNDIRKFGIIFSIICLPMSLLSFSDCIFKQHIADGTLELLLVHFSATEIVIAKFLSLCCCTVISFAINLPTIGIFLNVNYHDLFVLCLVLIFLLVLANSLLILIGAIQSYFRANVNFLAITIMPLLIPDIIISGLIIQNENYFKLIFIMLGINCIMLPSALFFSSYLIRNIYNS